MAGYPTAAQLHLCLAFHDCVTGCTLMTCNPAGSDAGCGVNVRIRYRKTVKPLAMAQWTPCLISDPSTVQAVWWQHRKQVLPPHLSDWRDCCQHRTGRQHNAALSVGVVRQVLECANPYKPPGRLSKTADKTQTDCSRHESLRTMTAGCLTLGAGCRMQSNTVQHSTRRSCHHAQPHQPRLVCASINMPACSVRLRPSSFFGSSLTTSSGG